MAWGTFAMAVFALIALFISGWGIWLLIVNLRESRKAVEAANRSAGAAERVARQDRAWVSITYSGEGERFGGHDDPDSIIYNFKILNTGATPVLEYRAIIKDFEGPDVKVEPSEIIQEMRASSKAFLAPGQGINRIFKLTREKINKLATVNKLGVSKPSVFYVVYICCEYTTIYNETFFIEQVYRSKSFHDQYGIKLTFAEYGDRSLINRVDHNGRFVQIDPGDL